MIYNALSQKIPQLFGQQNMESSQTYGAEKRSQEYKSIQQLSPKKLLNLRSGLLAENQTQSRIFETKSPKEKGKYCEGSRMLGNNDEIGKQASGSNLRSSVRRRIFENKSTKSSEIFRNSALSHEKNDKKVQPIFMASYVPGVGNLNNPITDKLSFIKNEKSKSRSKISYLGNKKEEFPVRNSIQNNPRVTFSYSSPKMVEKNHQFYRTNPVQQNYFQKTENYGKSPDYYKLQSNYGTQTNFDKYNNYTANSVSSNLVSRNLFPQEFSRTCSQELWKNIKQSHHPPQPISDLTKKPIIFRSMEVPSPIKSRKEEYPDEESQIDGSIISTFNMGSPIKKKDDEDKIREQFFQSSSPRSKRKNAESHLPEVLKQQNYQEQQEDDRYFDMDLGASKKKDLEFHDFKLNNDSQIGSPLLQSRSKIELREQDHLKKKKKKQSIQQGIGKKPSQVLQKKRFDWQGPLFSGILVTLGIFLVIFQAAR